MELYGRSRIQRSVTLRYVRGPLRILTMSLHAPSNNVSSIVPVHCIVNMFIKRSRADNSFERPNAVTNNSRELLICCKLFTNFFDFGSDFVFRHFCFG